VKVPEGEVAVRVVPCGAKRIRYTRHQVRAGGEATVCGVISEKFLPFGVEIPAMAKVCGQCLRIRALTSS